MYESRAIKEIIAVVCFTYVRKALDEEIEIGSRLFQDYSLSSVTAAALSFLLFVDEP